MDPRARSIPFVVGPTAAGKTDVAVDLAREANALILSIDARQAYRRLEAATGKPQDPRIRSIHRLLDIWDPSETGSATRFAECFWNEAERAWSQGRRILATAGSGLYLDACLGRMDPMPPANPEVRRRLRDQWEIAGGESIYQRLREVDPETAMRLSPRDAQRILRAMEVWETTGKPLSLWQQSGHGPLDVSAGPAMSLLVRDADDLGRRIAARCKAMVEAGLESEIRRLLDEGVPGSSPAFEALGYREWLQVVLGKMAAGEAMELFVGRTRQYARRQLTWFRNRYSGLQTLRWDPTERSQDISKRILTGLPRNWGLPKASPEGE